MKNYFKDPFIMEMENTIEHKLFLPLINRGTFCRVFSINSLIYKILENIPKEQNVNILVLGSGFDTLYFNLMSQKHTNITFLEFDYENIINKKLKIIEKSKILKGVISDNYHLLSCDITNKSKFKQSIESKITKEKLEDLTLVICECLLVYIEREETIDMLSTLKNLFPNLIILEYDLVGAKDAFGREMIDNLKMRNIELKGFEEVPDIKSQIERLKEIKLEQIEIVDLLYVYNKMIPKNERRRIDLLEMMDEFEEFNLLQQHACFGYGLSFKDNKYDKIKELIKLEK
jgi:tRNA wybutosine-synthesizing protein 4